MQILIPVLIALGVSLIVGFGLSMADTFFSVKKDEKEISVRNSLPGANCGACGFSGCDDYAEKLASGEITDCTLCKPGGKEAAQKIAEILGLIAGDVEPLTARVHCMGFCDKTSDKMIYHGVESCKAAALLFGGKGECQYGCIGFGDCTKECDSGAIKVCSGIAAVDPDECIACGKCIKACPKHLISLVPKEKAVFTVLCSNRDKGADVIKSCKAGCIGCKKCEKVCKNGAVKVESFLAVIDPEKCTGCGECAAACPRGVIQR